MVVDGKPFFMSNPDWFYFDEEEWKYKLKDGAPPEAVQSYKDFYRLLDSETD